MKGNMSFFVRENNVSKRNKKFTSIKRKTADKDDEIDSETEELNGINMSFKDYSDDENTETPDGKRLRLAKQYLEDIKKSDDEHDVSKKLKFEFLDSIGKLKKNVADDIIGYYSDKIITLKHKLQSQSVTSICLNSDEKILFAGCKNGKVLRWNIETKRQTGHISFDSHIMNITISSDNKFLAICDKSHKIFIYDPISLKKLHVFDGQHRGTVTGISFRKDSHQMFTCSEDRTIKVFSLDEMVYVETLFGHQNPVMSIDALYKERVLSAGGCDGTVRIWKIVEESQLVFNGGHKGSVDIVRFINEEHFLSCGDDGSLCVWNASKKRPINEFKLAHGSINGTANWITSIATLVNTDLIASGSYDGFIRIWKLNKNYREIILKFEIPVFGFINSLQFTNNGNHIIAGVGQEHRLGRWWSLKQAKNKILIIPLQKNK